MSARAVAITGAGVGVAPGGTRVAFGEAVAGTADTMAVAGIADGGAIADARAGDIGVGSGTPRPAQATVMTKLTMASAPRMLINKASADGSPWLVPPT